MTGLKNIGLSFFFLLIFGFSALAFSASSAGYSGNDFAGSVESVDVPVIYAPVHPIYLEIEFSNPSQTISEVHRLVSLAILSNREIPRNYDFRNTSFIAIQVNFNSPTPIFIRGHSLRI